MESSRSLSLSLSLAHTYDLIALKVGRIRPDPRGQLPRCEPSVVGVEAAVGAVHRPVVAAATVYVFVRDCGSAGS